MLRAGSSRSATGVEGWSVGDEVCALLSGGGYAEQVAVPVGQLLPVPAGVDLVTAAALPEVDLHGLVQRVHAGRPAPRRDAAGARRRRPASARWRSSSAGVLGARVAVTAGSAEKLERCRELGAEILVNYREQDFVEVVLAATDGRGADVVLDNMGAKYLAPQPRGARHQRAARGDRHAGRHQGRARPRAC